MSSILGTGYLMLDAGCSVAEIPSSAGMLVEDPRLAGILVTFLAPYALSLAPSIYISGYVNILGYLGSDCKCPNSGDSCLPHAGVVA